MDKRFRYNKILFILIAIFCRIQMGWAYTVTATANPTNGGLVTGDGTYNDGATATLTALSNMGYIFENWTENDEVVSTNNVFSFVVTADHQLVANFSQITNHWTPVTGMSGSMTISAILKIDGVEPLADYLEIGAFCGEECRGSALPMFDQGYCLYSLSVVGNTNGDTITFRLFDHHLDQELDLFCTNELSFQNDLALGLEELYEFNFISSVQITATADPTEGGTVEGAGGYFPGSEATLTATAAMGYTFQNWTLEGDTVSTNATYSFEVSGAADYVAHFSLNSYAISATADPDEGGTIEGAGTYSHFDTCTLTATANTGYTFVNWTLDGDTVSTNTIYSFEVSGAADYVGHFSLNSYEITASVEPEETGTVEGAGTYDHFATCTLTATAATGYTFINWTLDGDTVSTNATYSFEVNGAAIYVAHFSLNSYAISATVEPAEGGTIEGAGTYNHFDTCTLTATANTGYTFVNWTLDGDTISTNVTYSFEVSGAADYVAHFSLNSYEITASVEPEETGTVEGTGTYDHFATCTLTATAATGYTFINWTLDGDTVSTKATYSFEVSGAADYVAHFSLNSYAISATAEPAEGGTIEGAGTYNHFDTCTLTATANTGYTFVNWTLDGDTVSTNTIYSFEVSGAADFVAHFSLNTYAICAIADPNEGGTIEGAGTYNHFDTCTLTATAANNFTFHGWVVDNVTVSTETTYSFEVSGPLTVTAVFDFVQVNSLDQGWTWWSASVELNDIDGLEMLENSLGEMGMIIKTQDAYVQYFPSLGQWAGTLSQLHNENGYKLKVSGDCSATMTGPIVYPANHPITLQHNWNWIGYPSTEAQYVADAMANFQPENGDIIKSQGSFATYYTALGWVPATFSLNPGNTFLFFSNSEQAKTLTFGSGGRAMEELNDERHWRDNPHAYADNLCLTAVVTLDGEEQRSESLELGAFVDGECRGSTKLFYVEQLDRYYALMTITGTEGEQVYFALLDEANGLVSNDSPTQLGFLTDAVVGRLDEPLTVAFFGTTSLEEYGKRMTLYPNPVGCGETFSLDLPKEEDVAELTITNTLGAVVRHEKGALDRSVDGLPVSGVYLVRVTCKSGNVYQNRLVVR